MTDGRQRAHRGGGETGGTGVAGFREEALPHLDAVYRFALRLSGDPDRAEDLVQETFLRAYRAWAQYTPGTRCKSWLFTICRNVFLRSAERGRRHEEILSEEAAEDPKAISRENAVFVSSQPEDPEGSFFHSIVDEEVLSAIADLPEEFRIVVELSDREDLAYQEVAELLDVPVGTVKSRLFRGRKRLQARLRDYAVSAGFLSATGSSTAEPGHEGPGAGDGEGGR